MNSRHGCDEHLSGLSKVELGVFNLFEWQDSRHIAFGLKAGKRPGKDGGGHQGDDQGYANQNHDDGRYCKQVKDKRKELACMFRTKTRG